MADSNGKINGVPPRLRLRGYMSIPDASRVSVIGDAIDADKFVIELDGALNLYTDRATVGRLVEKMLDALAGDDLKAGGKEVA